MEAAECGRFVQTRRRSFHELLRVRSDLYVCPSQPRCRPHARSKGAAGRFAQELNMKYSVCVVCCLGPAARRDSEMSFSCRSGRHTVAREQTESSAEHRQQFLLGFFPIGNNRPAEIVMRRRCGHLCDAKRKCLLKIWKLRQTDSCAAKCTTGTRERAKPFWMISRQNRSRQPGEKQTNPPRSRWLWRRYGHILSFKHPSGSRSSICTKAFFRNGTMIQLSRKRP